MTAAGKATYEPVPVSDQTVVDISVSGPSASASASASAARIRHQSPNVRSLTQPTVSVSVDPIDAPTKRLTASASNAFSAAHRCLNQRPLVLCAIMSIFLLCYISLSMIFWQMSRIQSDSVSAGSAPRQLNASPDSIDQIPLSPVFERLAHVDVAWHAPPAVRYSLALNRFHSHSINDAIADSSSQSRTTKLTLLFHGCTHSARDWFTLPEERRIVRRLLAHAHHVLAISSLDRQTGCWDTQRLGVTDMNADVPRVMAALNRWAQQQLPHIVQQLQQSNQTNRNDILRLHAIGASSGGSFVSMMSRLLPFDSVVIQISPGVTDALTAPQTLDFEPLNSLIEFGRFTAHHFDFSISRPQFSHLHPVPRCAFIVMSLDLRWASEARVMETIKSMRAAGVDVLGPVVSNGAGNSHRDNLQMLTVSSRPFDAALLMQRVDELYTLIESNAWRHTLVDALIEALVKDEALNATTRMLVKDSRAIRLRQIVHSLSTDVEQRSDMTPASINEQAAAAAVESADPSFDASNVGSVAGAGAVSHQPQTTSNTAEPTPTSMSVTDSLDSRTLRATSTTDYRLPSLSARSFWSTSAAFYAAEELLNLADGKHEMTSQHMEYIVQWFDKM